MEASVWISLAALIVAVVSYHFARVSWRETNRPIVTARIVTCGTGLGDSLSTAALVLLVENSGNRPAKNIRLRVPEQVLASAFEVRNPDSERADIRANFSAKFTIPVLTNGGFSSNSFGLLSHRSDSTWKFHVRLPLCVSYEDLDERKFCHHQELLIADNSGFAGSHWEDCPSPSGRAPSD
jgi:hypothetical protein